jgi:hypothetical protein
MSVQLVELPAIGQTVFGLCCNGVAIGQQNVVWRTFRGINRHELTARH